MNIVIKFVSDLGWKGLSVHFHNLTFVFKVYTLGHWFYTTNLCIIDTCHKDRCFAYNQGKNYCATRESHDTFLEA